MRAERTLVWVIAALGVTAPLLIGAVHPWTQVGLSAGAFAVTLAWLAMRGKRGLRVVPFLVPAALGAAFTLVQLVPLPSVLVGFLSPHALELRAGAAGTSPSWLPFTVDAPATWLEAAKGLAYLGLLITLAGLIRSRRRARRVLGVLASLGAGLMVLTLIERVVGAKSILGLYHLHSQPGSGFFGTFVDGNHAASVFSIGALVAAGLALELDGGRRFVALCAAVLSASGVLFTTSRAGAAGLAAGGFAFAAIVFGRRFGRARGLLGALTLAVIFCAGGLWISDGLRSRIAGPQSGSLTDNQKVRGWGDGMEMAAHYPWTGVGRGAFGVAIDGWRANDEGVRLVYPEDAVVQLASEWGLPVAAAVLVLVLLAGLEILPLVEKLEPGAIGAACAVLAVVVHELGDFGLEFPGVAFPTVIALGLVIGRCEELAGSRRAEKKERRAIPALVGAVGLLLWAVALGGAAWAAPHTLDADWSRCKAAVKAHAPDAPSLLASAIARHPAADHLELLAAELSSGDALAHVNRALLLHPASQQAHHLAALLLARMNHRGQAALELRLMGEHGGQVAPDELVRVAGSHAIDAVPQTPARLFELAHYLVRTGRAKLGWAAAARAVELADGAESARTEQTRIAVEIKAPAELKEAAHALIASDPAASGYLLAAQALAQAGDARGADDALARGMKAHATDGELVLGGARLEQKRGNLAGARAMLRRIEAGGFTLADREAGEELSAELAEQAGDVDDAIVARARARMIAGKIKALDIP